ncbi:protein meaA [Magnetospirillum gryphiswaldense]|uniref:Methylmalonyl-CoA mutase n=2 Tax=Magnetospirillum gryphiswaldense TaxID=55518 RepID=V6F5X1_MAGGM|nr:protein meaA [Magnetospirillum gryphiswaldense]AVM76152.1 Methylmalonyl-CoA mutase [Magnetospirillum gryphiswaldense MSR-1]AVM80055.1 Methylmalonyl-CoA mutase [Magnetospirillum gryphiswaldense]CAM77403.1 Methylmalonyl-CoA mutase [Magnetospirillum gryphiswaldense MSR-1]CDK99888.1 methylmalonyl-CoA mutase [Magnetospirillum gryphiswaldense MSR-1 v2]
MTDKTPAREKPWLFRTYSGHSSAAESNKLFRANLGKGQTGLSVAFDLPTQTGYDSDHVLARGEVGKVGVPICHIGDMMTLFQDIPLEKMNTSMTINAPAAWLLSLYIATAEKQGAARSSLNGTTQNDIIKEYLSRGTYIFGPQHSLRLTSDVIAFTYREVPKWNPMNVCSYHLQEAGATPEQELAFALATAIAVLDTVRPVVPPEDFSVVVSRISFFVNAGIRFVTELCKMRSFTYLWDEICRTRYGITDEKARRFRYGVQVNSLGLTEPQPENNVYRILLEMLAVVLSKDARARAVQLPAWNEALGLPREWDQQWSLRLQQIVAYETDLLEFGDIFNGSTEIQRKVDELMADARDELKRIDDMGGAVSAVESSYMKQKLVEANARRIGAIESGEQIVVGVNKWTETEPSPLTGGDGSILTVDHKVEAEQIERLKAFKATRDQGAVEAALAGLRAAASEGRNVMEPSITAAHAGVTTGEWAQTLREVFGEYRAPTGVSRASANTKGEKIVDVRAKVETVSAKLGRRVKMLVGKPGLDGHSNGAEQIAVRARDAGMEVVYEGIRLTPAQIVNAALEEGVHVVGLSILSGSHIPLVTEVLERMKAAGIGDIPVVAGGIIPPEDEKLLLAAGCARIYTPKDYDITTIMGDIVDLVGARAA